jgi:chemotaxis regulatin CheY-phosphate phosphatase CheZ
MAHHTDPDRAGEQHPAAASSSQPVQDDLVKALAGVVTMLDRVQGSLRETTETIPKASHQLHDVTRATESATVEILDVLDSMSHRIEDAERGIIGLRDHVARRSVAEQDLDRLLTGFVRSGQKGADADRLLAQWQEFRSASDTGAALGAIEQSLADTKKESTSIAMALQVQDITSQQIAGALHLLDSVRNSLLGVLQSLAGGENETSAGRLPTGFDPQARYGPSGGRQETADAIVRQWQKGNNE